MKKKIVALCLVVGLLAVSVIGGTLAYFTDNDDVTNTFSVGKVDITMDEAKTDEYGKRELDPETEEPVARVDANEYKLVPGGSYVKDPTIHVADGSENAFLYVQVNNGLANVLTENCIEKQLADNGWELVENTENIYAFQKHTNLNMAVTAGQSVNVFDEFVVDSAMNEETLNAVANSTIVVRAFAIQADNIEESVADAEAVAYFTAP